MDTAIPRIPWNSFTDESRGPDIVTSQATATAGEISAPTALQQLGCSSRHVLLSYGVHSGTLNSWT